MRRGAPREAGSRRARRRATRIAPAHRLRPMSTDMSISFSVSLRAVAAALS
ncbi:DUF1223 domain-containing protein, partial [Burkholderia pseudomallei]